jgi:hypothetical protein
MTDQGSASHPPDDEERAPGADPEAPSPFSRESSGAGAHSLGAGDQPHPSGDPSGPAAADPYGYPPAPDAGTDQGTGYPTYGQPDPGSPDGPDQGYGQNRYPSGAPEADPSQPFGRPSSQPYVPPGPNPYADPSRPYGQPTVDPSGQPGMPGAPGAGEPRPQYDPQLGSYGPSPYGTGPGQAYEVSPYQGTYGGYAAYGAAPVQHPQVVAALVTGLLGVLMCPFVGIAAMVLGSKARREIDSDPQRYTGRGMATAGFVLGIVGTVLTVLGVLGIIAIVGLATTQ